MLDGDLLKTRVNSKTIGEELLVYGSCIGKEYPGVLEDFADISRLGVCLEEFHVDQVAWKLQSMIREGKVRKVTALTMDGSPHCVQLHYALEDIKRIFPTLEVSHHVIEKGELMEISGEAVRKSRHLSELEG